MAFWQLEGWFDWVGMISKVVGHWKSSLCYPLVHFQHQMGNEERFLLPLLLLSPAYGHRDALSLTVASTFPAIGH
jgi:hypothetical protein